jgi:hypothetical protein
MILASVMLAIYLGWPLAFGGARRGLETPAEGRGVTAVPAARHIERSALAEAKVPEATAATRPESCYKRYQREVKLCNGATAAACKLGAADHWDMCEVTGFWPN